MEEGKQVITENGAYAGVLTAGEYTITAMDKAGNSVTVSVTVNAGHTPETDDGDCTTAVYCGVCGALTTEAMEHDFSGEFLSDETGHWHVCRNAGCTVTEKKMEHTFVWMIDREATPIQAGLKHEECEICGYKKEAVETISPEVNESPKTADIRNYLFWLLLAAGTGCTGTVIYRRKRNKKQ